MGYISGQIQMLTLMALPFLFAVTMPQAARAYVANYLGDPTPKLAGRMSFDPLKHVDKMGTVVMPAISMLLGFPILLGYGKPIDVQPANFKSGRNSIVFFALAGPLSNLIVALIFAYFIRLAGLFSLLTNEWIVLTLQYGVLINCLFMVISLLPIPPLDGGTVLAQYLPKDVAESYMSVAPYGFLILLGIFILAQPVILGPTYALANFLVQLVGAPF